jgi:hypothetical protein
MHTHCSICLSAFVSCFLSLFLFFFFPFLFLLSSFFWEAHFLARYVIPQFPAGMDLDRRLN